MVREYIYSHFIVLYQTSTRSKERLDEIILLSLEEISNRNLQRIEEDNHSREKKGEKILEIPPMKLLKIREAPRRFSKYNLVNAEESCIYYWSNKLGAHLMKTSWKEKNGVIVVDKDEIIDGARKQAAEEGNRYDNDELDAYLMKINEMHIRYHFEKTGYYYNADAYGGDWARSELSVHFNENSFRIDDLEVNRLMILSHWEVDEAWKKAESMLASRQWGMQELAEIIKLLDTYDTNVQLKYSDNGKVCIKNIRMNGGKIEGYEEEGWAPEIIAVIDSINDEYKNKCAKR